MSVNSSFTINDLLMGCSNFTVRVHMAMAITAVRSFMLLPLSTLVLYLGFQQWRRQQGSFKSTSHCDLFTYNMAVMEVIWTVLNFCLYHGRVTHFTATTTAGVYSSTLIFCGQIFFHLLTCVDRYLAVVYPITYMRVRNSRGVWIRNISVVCVWLLSFVLSGLSSLLPIPDFPIILAFCLLAFSITAISFCSLSVLCVLIRPRPGERGGDRQQFDQSKQRAFYTITAIMAVLCLWILGFLVLLALNSSTLLSPSATCLLVPCAGWFSLPSSVLLPVLYLHRAGKLPCCSNQ